MLLFEKKNLGFRDFVRLQQLEEQLGPLAFDGNGDEQQKLGLLHRYNAILDKIVHADPRGAPSPGSSCEPLPFGDGIFERMPTPTASSSSPAPNSSDSDDAAWLSSGWPWGLGEEVGEHSESGV
tara:strand:- start:2496 stop:2867 length:372 start_codon:yes stop_codon:yes gene_type:complete